MGEIFKIIEIILLSSVKFIAGPPFAYYNHKYSFGFVETVTYSVIGGMLGVVVFTYLGDQIFIFWHWLKMNFKKFFRRKTVFSDPTVDIDQPVEVRYSYVDKSTPQIKLFTPRNRKIVRMWHKYGLVGIAFLTPVILSVPLGAIIAERYVHNKKKIFLYMFISLLFWSVLMTSLFALYKVYSIKALEREMLK